MTTPTLAMLPGSVDLAYDPRNPLRFRIIGWAHGALDGRTFAAKIGDVTLDTTVIADTIEVAATSVNLTDAGSGAGAIPWILLDADTDIIILTGYARPTTAGGPSTTSIYVTQGSQGELVVQTIDLAGEASAVAAQLQVHINDAVGAHAATAISFAPTDDLSDTNVQDALAAAGELSAGLTDALTAEAAARTTADIGLSTAITSEASARASADSGLSSAITTEATARASAVSGEASARATAVTNEATARANADALLIPLTQKAAANGVATLDAGGKVPQAQIPDVALSQWLGDVASQAAMLALTGQPGDWCVRTDLTPNQVFMLKTTDPTQVGNWQGLGGPGAVFSVNGRAGSVTGLAESADLATETTRAEAAEAVLYAIARRPGQVVLGFDASATFNVNDYGTVEQMGDAVYDAMIAHGGEIVLLPGLYEFTGRGFVQPPNTVLNFLGGGDTKIGAPAAPMSKGAILRWKAGTGPADAGQFLLTMNSWCELAGYASLDGNKAHLSGAFGNGLLLAGRRINVPHLYVQQCKGNGLDGVGGTTLTKITATIATASNGADLAVVTQINVDPQRKGDFDTSGTLAVPSTAGTQTVAYTGLLYNANGEVVGVSGISGGTGTLSAGGVIVQSVSKGSNNFGDIEVGSCNIGLVGHGSDWHIGNLTTYQNAIGAFVSSGSLHIDFWHSWGNTGRGGELSGGVVTIPGYDFETNGAEGLLVDAGVANVQLGVGRFWLNGGAGMIDKGVRTKCVGGTFYDNTGPQLILDGSTRGKWIGLDFFDDRVTKLATYAVQYKNSADHHKFLGCDMLASDHLTGWADESGAGANNIYQGCER